MVIRELSSIPPFRLTIVYLVELLEIELQEVALKLVDEAIEAAGENISPMCLYVLLCLISATMF